MAWPQIILLLAQATAPPTPVQGDTVVVTAPAATLRAAWERCVKGGCTPREDVIASIRYAEVLFRDGRYLDARRLLQGAIGRDRSAAASEPVALAALYEATVTVATHDGEQDVAQHASGDRAGVLRRSFGPADPRTLQAELDDIDLQRGLAQRDGVASRYGALARRAADAHQPVIAAAVALRQATLAYGDGRRQAATDLLDRLAADPTQAEGMRFAARVLLARFARDHGDVAATDRLIAAYAASALRESPLLVWQPPLPGPDDPAAGNPTSLVTTADVALGFTGLRWADIGFSIKPDGTVDTPEWLRGSRGTDGPNHSSLRSPRAATRRARRRMRHAIASSAGRSPPITPCRWAR